jgi:hypothetical protein
MSLYSSDLKSVCELCSRYPVTTLALDAACAAGPGNHVHVGSVVDTSKALPLYLQDLTVWGKFGCIYVHLSYILVKATSGEKARISKASGQELNCVPHREINSRRRLVGLRGFKGLSCPCGSIGGTPSRQTCRIRTLVLTHASTED